METGGEPDKRGMLNGLKRVLGKAWRKGAQPTLKGYHEGGWKGAAGAASRIGEDHPHLDADSETFRRFTFKVVALASRAASARTCAHEMTRVPSGALMVAKLFHETANAGDDAIRCARVALGASVFEWNAAFVRAGAHVHNLRRCTEELNAAAEEDPEKNQKGSPALPLGVDAATGVQAEMVAICNAFDPNLAEAMGI